MIGSAKPYTFDRVVRMVLSAIAAVALFSLIRYLSDVLLPFAAAVVLAYFLNPLVNVFEERLKRRWAAVAFTLAMLVIVALAAAVIVTPLAYSQVNRFNASLGQLRADLAASLPPATMPVTSRPTTTSAPGDASAADMVLGFDELMQGWDEYRRDAATMDRAARLRRFQSRVTGTYAGLIVDDTVAYIQTDEFRTQALPALMSRLYAGGMTVVNYAVRMILAIVGGVLVLIYLFFLLLDFPEYARTWKGFLPPDYREPITAFLSEFDHALRRYFRGQFIVATITGVLFCIGFTLIGLPMAVPFGLLIGAMNMVPYLQTLTLLPALLLAVMRSVETSGSIGASVGLVLLVYAVAQVLQDGVITPRVMGQATGLRPVVILLGVFIWGRLLGFLGLILAIPLTCVFIAYYRRFILNQTMTAAQPAAATTAAPASFAAATSTASPALPAPLAAAAPNPPAAPGAGGKSETLNGGAKP